jgi:hypothetical protein
MRKIAAATAAVLAALTLTACGTDDAPVQAPTPSMTVGPATPTPSETAESAREPSVTPGPVQVTPQDDDAPADPTEGMTAEERYIYYADQSLQAWGVDLTDEELLSAGLYVCEQLAAEVVRGDIVALEGAEMLINEGVVLNADEYLCGA